MYTGFAEVYDTLMNDVHYGAWADMYARMMTAYGIPRNAKVCECACGTGGLTLPLQQLGYEMMGIDLSQEMLWQAAQKARKAGFGIPFIRQDMRQLRLHRPVDAVLATCDGVNYLLQDVDAAAFFQSAWEAIKPGGGLFFDVSTPYKLEHLLGSQFMGEDRRDVTYMWQNRYFPERQALEERVGVVNGLAWTAVGGTLLEAEANVIPGSGKVELTGNLGNVMKESARAAFTYIRSRAVQLGIEANFYKEKDIHVHFPEGAVPKDGPSAGVTITTAMVSALTGIPVRGDVAMTGEVTLRGRVLPIGGLREKSMAALRNGIHTVIIPKDNEPDLEEIDQTVRSALQFIPVDHVDQVLANALERPPLAQPDQAGGQVPVVGPETGSTHATIPQA